MVTAVACGHPLSTDEEVVTAGVASAPGSYQRLDLFIKVLRVLCPNLTDASKRDGTVPHVGSSKMNSLRADHGPCHRVTANRLNG